MLPQYTTSSVNSRSAWGNSQTWSQPSVTSLEFPSSADYAYLKTPHSSSSSFSSQNFFSLTRRRIWKKYQATLRNVGIKNTRTALIILILLIFIFSACVIYAILPSGEPVMLPKIQQEEIIPEISENPDLVQPTVIQRETPPLPTIKEERADKADKADKAENPAKPAEKVEAGKTGETGVPQEQKSPTVLTKEEIDRRREAVKAAFKHAWDGYEKHAFGHDEIRPCTNQTNDSWNGWGVTLVDALDTMYLMGFFEEFQRARDFVSTLNFKIDKSVSFFETTIRYLGGFLSAYTLSEDPVFLQKAVELGDGLLPAFNTPTGIAMHGVHMITGKSNNPGYTRESSILAETGTVQLEFKYLSFLTGNQIYAEQAQKSMDVLDNAKKKIPGLYPLYVSPVTGEFTTSQISFGALADSFYEYLLKQYIQTGNQEDQFKRMYLESVDGMKNHLIDQIGSVTLLGEMNFDRKVPEMDHLLCFVPGMLALGAQVLEIPEHLDLAKKLLDTCYMLYADQPSGIGPEKVRFDTDPDPITKKPNYRIISGAYYLRPETLESIFIMYRLTGDQKYQEWGWKIFLGIEKYCKTDSAYSGLVDVSKNPPEQNNSMQSFFLAETLKYLFLLFSDPSLLPLDQFVFNTEAHPLKIYRKN